MTNKRAYIYKSPIGAYQIEHIDSKLCRLQLITEEDANQNLNDSDTDLTKKVIHQLEQYFKGLRTEFEIPIDYSRCTPFQQRVYSEMQQIPYGECRTYKQIATAIGNPNASRAVGMAANRNPIQLIIPCHRVVGTNGSLTGYAGGLSIKERLLDIELNSPNLPYITH